MPPSKVKITEEYARLVAHDVFFWAWPLVNVYNRRIANDRVPDFIYAGPVPLAPVNRLAMLTDYITPEERLVACPNQDVVYGAGSIALDRTAVVIQVPDFSDRFWVYQIVDLRTDSFADLGKMYGTTPGFYMLVGPDWSGEVPKGITQVFRASTNTGYVIPRAFQDDSPEDKRAIQATLSQIMMYPVAEFTGDMLAHDWINVPRAPETGQGGDEETKWVPPEKFFDVLGTVLEDAPPMPGEGARYEQVRALLDAASDPRIKAAIVQAAIDADATLVGPLIAFRTWGLQLPHNWSTQDNGAQFGADYFTRTAVARSNIFVNKPIETRYFYQDLDSSGGRLNGAKRYTVTFTKGLTPPVNGFWSLTLYNEHHFFAPNDLKRYSIGTKNRKMKYNVDGSLTIYVQTDPPGDDYFANWLPSPKGGDFSLYIRAYWPKVGILDGSWTPPAVQRA
ncbi:MAG: DUF1254 domain-containing protein [Candidatus Cybelea sp.]|jgi:hypothetical protein